MAKSLDYLSINEEYFSEIRHYSDRKMIWLKLHFNLLKDYTFSTLKDEQKFHFIGLLILAAESNNKFPNDSRFLQNRLSTTSKIDIELLIKKELLKPYKPSRNRGLVASKSQADRKQKACPEQQQEQLSVVRIEQPQSSISVVEHTQNGKQPLVCVCAATGGKPCNEKSLQKLREKDYQGSVCRKATKLFVLKQLIQDEGSDRIKTVDAFVNSIMEDGRMNFKIKVFVKDKLGLVELANQLVD